MSAFAARFRSAARLRLAADRLERWPPLWAAVLLIVLVLAALASMRLGAVAIPGRELLPALTEPEHPLHGVLWQVRIPRVGAAALVGAALAVAGALMQTVVRNPLADPGLLGVNAGAGLAALFAIVLWPARTLLLPLIAFAGALVTVLAILLAAWGPRRRLGPLKIILSGVAIQAILVSMIALVMFLYADRAPAFVAFMVGSLNGVGWPEARLAVGPLAAGLALALAGARPLNLLLLDDATAAGVGLEVARVRLAAGALAALLAAAAVSVAGLVGFVGLIVPNWVRVVSGPDHRTLLPLAALGGGALVVIADLAARVAVAPVELPVGALLALVGGPYFLFVLWRRLA
jgi:iron complex transport system permease protein